MRGKSKSAGTHWSLADAALAIHLKRHGHKHREIVATVNETGTGDLRTTEAFTALFCGLRSSNKSGYNKLRSKLGLISTAAVDDRSVPFTLAEEWGVLERVTEYQAYKHVARRPSRRRNGTPPAPPFKGPYSGREGKEFRVKWEGGSKSFPNEMEARIFIGQHTPQNEKLPFSPPPAPPPQSLQVPIPEYLEEKFLQRAKELAKLAPKGWKLWIEIAGVGLTFTE